MSTKKQAQQAQKWTSTFLHSRKKTTLVWSGFTCEMKSGHHYWWVCLHFDMQCGIIWTREHITDCRKKCKTLQKMLNLKSLYFAYVTNDPDFEQ